MEERVYFIYTSNSIMQLGRMQLMVSRDSSKQVDMNDFNCLFKDKYAYIDEYKMGKNIPIVSTMYKKYTFIKEGSRYRLLDDNEISLLTLLEVEDTNSISITK